MQALLGSLRNAESLAPRSLGSAAAALQFRACAAASGQLNAIKALRERTSAPILDVKSALVEASWNEGGRPSAAMLTFALTFPALGGCVSVRVSCDEQIGVPGQFIFLLMSCLVTTSQHSRGHVLM